MIPRLGSDGRRVLALVGGLVLAFLCTARAWAQAEPVHRVALVSMIGPQLQLTLEQAQTGSHLDANRHAQANMTQTRLDQAALAAVLRALAQVRQVEALQQMFVLEPAVQPTGGRHAVGDIVNLPQQVLDDAQRQGADRLLLIDRLRGEARLRAKHSLLGEGRIEGVGLYLNPTQAMRSPSGEMHRGFVAPYVYLNVVLLDARSATVLSSQAIEVSTTRAWVPAKGDQANATARLEDLATPAHVRALLRLLDQSLAEAVVAVVTPPQAARPASAPR